MLPYVTLHKDGESKRVFLVDSGPFFAHGWSLEKNLPVVREAPPEPDGKEPEIETPKNSTRKPRKPETPDDEQSQPA